MCTLDKVENVYILTLTGNDEHRLTPTLIDSITSALQRLRSETPSALITTAHGKFFSNGYDLAWAKSDPQRIKLMSSKFRSLITDIISLPMPTIAAVSGHCSASGFILALSHDYVLMRKDRGFLYMSEQDIDLVIPTWFMTMLRYKIASPLVWRDVVLRAEKLTGNVAVQKGIIDSAHDSVEDTFRAAVKLGEELVRRNWSGDVYAQNRRVLLGDVLDAIGSDESVDDVVGVAKAISRL